MAKARLVVIVIELYRVAKVTLAKTKFISLSQSLPAYIKNLKKDFIIAIIYDIIYIGDLGEAVKK